MHPQPSSSFLLRFLTKTYIPLKTNSSHGVVLPRYTCCQGYICTRCMSSTDDLARSCPWLCLCFETFFCPSCAVSSTRLYVQDERQLITDPCDNRIIVRFCPERPRSEAVLYSCSCLCLLVSVSVCLSVCLNISTCEPSSRGFMWRISNHCECHFGSRLPGFVYCVEEQPISQFHDTYLFCCLGYCLWCWFVEWHAFVVTQDISSSLTLTMLFLLDHPSTRQYLRPDLEIEKLFSVFTDTTTPNSRPKEARRAAAHKVCSDLFGFCFDLWTTTATTTGTVDDYEELDRNLVFDLRYGQFKQLDPSVGSASISQRLFLVQGAEFNWQFSFKHRHCSLASTSGHLRKPYLICSLKLCMWSNRKTSVKPKNDICGRKLDQIYCIHILQWSCFHFCNVALLRYAFIIESILWCSIS